MLQTVAMATNNLKDNPFLLFFPYLLPFLELALVKYLETLVKTISDNNLRRLTIVFRFSSTLTFDGIKKSKIIAFLTVSW